MEATSRYAKALRATVERDPRSGGCRGAASFNHLQAGQSRAGGNVPRRRLANPYFAYE
jgi:hypothetical protein